MGRKKGSGRTKGAGSFVQVSLKELNRVLREDAIVIINRRYAEMIGLQNQKFVATTENIQNVSTQVDVQEHNLEEETEIGIATNEW